MAKKYNCEKNGIPYFRKTKTIGHKADGTAVKKEFYGNGEKDCDRQIEEYMDKLKSGLNVDIENLTVEQGMHQWLFDVLLHSKNIKSASFEKHECNYRNYIKDRKIGCICVQNAVSLPFQRYYNNLYQNGIKIYNKKTKEFENKKVSSDKISDLNKTLRAFFNWCIRQHYTLDNPCSLQNIEVPGNADGEEDEQDIEGTNIQAFNDKEIQIIIDNLKYISGEDNTFRVMIMLDFVTGLRSGEIRGLKKKFVIKYLVKVRNTLKKLKIFDAAENWHYETKLIKPKSKSSIRDVNFPIAFYSILKQYFKEQEKKWENNGLEFNDESLLFTTKTCLPIDEKNFSRAWERFLKKNKIKYKKPHSIRDTYSTTLLRKGAKLHDVKEMLGHSSIKITEKYYVFVFPEDKSKTANLLNDLISPAKLSREKVGKLKIL